MTARACALPLFAVATAALCATCASSRQNTPERGSVSVILERDDYNTPPSKAKFCRYSGRMITSCEFQLVLLKYPDPEAAMSEVGAAYIATKKRETARANACVNRAMTEPQARQAWECLESLTDCSQLPRCVGDDYHGDPTDQLGLHLLTSER